MASILCRDLETATRTPARIITDQSNKTVPTGTVAETVAHAKNEDKDFFAR